MNGFWLSKKLTSIQTKSPVSRMQMLTAPKTGQLPPTQTHKHEAVSPIMWGGGWARQAESLAPHSASCGHKAVVSPRPAHSRASRTASLTCLASWRGQLEAGSHEPLSCSRLSPWRVTGPLSWQLIVPKGLHAEAAGSLQGSAEHLRAIPVLHPVGHSSHGPAPTTGREMRSSEDLCSSSIQHISENRSRLRL